jgi:hypothetical protein
MSKAKITVKGNGTTGAIRIRSLDQVPMTGFIQDIKAIPEGYEVTQGDRVFKLTSLETILCYQLKVSDTPQPLWHYRWHASRNWEADGAYFFNAHGGGLAPTLLEMDGGVTPFRDKSTGQLRQGRHNTITGYEDDCEKLNAAADMGLRVYRFTRRMADDWRALQTIRRFLGMKEYGAN